MTAARKTSLDEIGSLDAPPGTRPWAVAVRRELQSLLRQYECDHKHVRTMLDLVIEHDGFRELEDRRGGKFKTFEAFCTEPYPWGLGYSREAIERVKADLGPKTPQQRAQSPPTLLDVGRPEANGDKGSERTIKRGETADYLTARIKRDHPDILRRMKAGEFPSVRAAAVAAGIVKVPTAYEAALRAVAKLSKAEKRRLLKVLSAESDG